MSYWKNKPDADEIAAELADRLRVENGRIDGFGYAAVAIAGKADEWCGIAYANGYKAALDDCERADVAKLIEEVTALQSKLAFERALRSDAERRYEHAAANYAESCKQRSAN